MESLADLRNAWAKIGVPWDAEKFAREGDGYSIETEFELSHEDPSLPYILNGKTGLGRHMSDWLNTMRFIASLPPMEEVSVLVTAMSVGADLWDGQVAAEQAGVFPKHGKVTFLGHEISSLFTQRADVGIYPKSKTLHIEDPQRYFESTEYSEFVSVREELRGRAKFLEPSNIRYFSEARDFCVADVVVSNIMNPAPSPLSDFLKPCARHLVVSQSDVLFMSDEWRANNLKFG